VTSAQVVPRVPRDAGSAALELVVLTPALLALLLLVIAAGRITAATGQVDGAARDAARAASLERSLPDATAAARSTAAASLAGQDVRCRRIAVRVAGDYAAPVGTPSAVRVRVGCTVDLSDLGLPLPRSKTLHASYTAVLDRHRGR
jgi:Flp pilus assembly protein TadG